MITDINDHEMVDLTEIHPPIALEARSPVSVALNQNQDVNEAVCPTEFLEWMYSSPPFPFQWLPAFLGL